MCVDPFGADQHTHAYTHTHACVVCIVCVVCRVCGRVDVWACGFGCVRVRACLCLRVYYYV